MPDGGFIGSLPVFNPGVPSRVYVMPTVEVVGSSSSPFYIFNYVLQAASDAHYRFRNNISRNFRNFLNSTPPPPSRLSFYLSPRGMSPSQRPFGIGVNDLIPPERLFERLVNDPAMNDEISQLPKPECPPHLVPASNPPPWELNGVIQLSQSAVDGGTYNAFINGKQFLIRTQQELAAIMQQEFGLRPGQWATTMGCGCYGCVGIGSPQANHRPSLNIYTPRCVTPPIPPAPPSLPPFPPPTINWPRLPCLPPADCDSSPPDNITIGIIIAITVAIQVAAELSRPRTIYFAFHFGTTGNLWRGAPTIDIRLPQQAGTYIDEPYVAMLSLPEEWYFLFSSAHTVLNATHTGPQQFPHFSKGPLPNPEAATLPVVFHAYKYLYVFEVHPLLSSPLDDGFFDALADALLGIDVTAYGFQHYVANYNTAMADWMAELARVADTLGIMLVTESEYRRMLEEGEDVSDVMTYNMFYNRYKDSHSLPPKPTYPPWGRLTSIYGSTFREHARYVEGLYIPKFLALNFIDYTLPNPLIIGAYRDEDNYYHYLFYDGTTLKIKGHLTEEMIDNAYSYDLGLAEYLKLSVSMSPVNPIVPEFVGTGTWSNPLPHLGDTSGMQQLYIRRLAKHTRLTGTMLLTVRTYYVQTAFHGEISVPGDISCSKIINITASLFSNYPQYPCSRDVHLAMTSGDLEAYAALYIGLTSTILGLLGLVFPLVAPVTTALQTLLGLFSSVVDLQVGLAKIENAHNLIFLKSWRYFPAKFIVQCTEMVLPSPTTNAIRVIEEHEAMTGGKPLSKVFVLWETDSSFNPLTPIPLPSYTVVDQIQIVIPGDEHTPDVVVGHCIVIAYDVQLDSIVDVPVANSSLPLLHCWHDVR